MSNNMSNNSSVPSLLKVQSAMFMEIVFYLCFIVIFFMNVFTECYIF